MNVLSKEPKIYLLVDHQRGGLAMAAAGSRRSILRAARDYTGKTRIQNFEWPGVNTLPGSDGRGNLLRIIVYAPSTFGGYRTYEHVRYAVEGTVP